MRHLFDPLFLGLLASWLCVTVWCAFLQLAFRQADPATEHGVEAGMVDFQLAKSEAQVKEIWNSWGGTGREKARANLRIDRQFVVASALWIVLLYALIGYGLGARGQKLVWLVLAVAGIATVAASCDAIENHYLNRLLGEELHTWDDVLATHAVGKARPFAQIKFTAWSILTVGGTYLLLRRLLKKKPQSA